MSAIIAVAALILFWWIYSAGRKVDSNIYISDDIDVITIAEGAGTTVWYRGLTSKEMLEVLEAGYENIYEYNSWEEMVEEHPHLKHYVTLPFKFKN
jgi:hypothetical protein